MSMFSSRCPLFLCGLCGELVLPRGQWRFQLRLSRHIALYEGLHLPLCCYRPPHPSRNNWVSLSLFASITRQNTWDIENGCQCVSRNLRCFEMNERGDSTTSWPAVGPSKDGKLTLWVFLGWASQLETRDYCVAKGGTQSIRPTNTFYLKESEPTN